MTPKPVKVVDLVKKKFSYSFEVTPDVCLEDFGKIKSNPAFISVTWHSRRHGCTSLDIGPLNVAKTLAKDGKVIMLHLACDMMRKNFLNSILKLLKENSICNLFVMLGETYDEKQSDFKTSKDLVQYIRKETGDYFCIGVAGFPRDPDENLTKLKEKIESGANFIVTQALFDASLYRDFIKKCESLGIKVPILAGILYFDKYDDLYNFTTLDKIPLPQEMLNKVKLNPGPESKMVLKKIITDIRQLDLKYVNFQIFTMNHLVGASELLIECK